MYPALNSVLRQRKEEIILPAVHPNQGLQALYRQKIERLLDAMRKSIDYWVAAAYNNNEPEVAKIAQDESPAAAMREVMKRLTAYWQKRFNKAAPDLAKYFATAVDKRVSSVLKTILKDAGFAVSFKLSREANDVLQATMWEQVGLIKSIPQQYLADVEGLVMRSVATGRDLATLNNELLKRYQITKRRAALIARDQNNKATAVITRVRQDSLGITDAIWLHSHGGKTPRPEHLAFSGKRYKIATGAFLEGKWTWPGVEINCRCVSKSVIPGI